MDLYAILKIKRNVKPETIKKAFRRRSMQTHPDRGGTQAEFEQVRLAYAILSDPAKKARYDATGEIDSNSAAKIQSAVLGMAMGYFIDAINQCVNKRKSPQRDNVLEIVRITVRQQISEHRKALQAGKDAEKVIAEVQSRLTSKDPEDFIRQGIEAQVAKLHADFKQIEEQIHLREQVLEMLKVYEYRTDPACSTMNSSSATAFGIPIMIQWETLDAVRDFLGKPQERK